MAVGAADRGDENACDFEISLSVLKALIKDSFCVHSGGGLVAVWRVSAARRSIESSASTAAISKAAAVDVVNEGAAPGLT